MQTQTADVLHELSLAECLLYVKYLCCITIHDLLFSNLKESWSPSETRCETFRFWRWSRDVKLYPKSNWMKSQVRKRHKNTSYDVISQCLYVPATTATYFRQRFRSRLWVMNPCAWACTLLSAWCKQRGKRWRTFDSFFRGHAPTRTRTWLAFQYLRRKQSMTDVVTALPNWTS